MKELIDANLSFVLYDHDDKVIKKLTSILSSVSDKISVFENILTMLNKIKESKSDVYIISNKTEHIDIINLFQKIKALNPNAMFVVLLDKYTLSDVKHLIEFGVDFYINKPINANVLIEILEKISKTKMYDISNNISRINDVIEDIYMISKHNLDGDVTYANKNLTSFFGISFEKMVNAKFNPMFQHDEIDLMWERLKAGKKFTTQLEYADDNGEKVLKINISPIYNADDEIIEYISFLEDITKSVMITRELEIKEMNFKLSKLKAQKSKNEEISKIKDNFINIFNHELKTPLNSIINFSSHLSKTINKLDISKKEKMLTQLNLIEENGSDMVEMIEKVLFAIKLKDDMVEIESSNIDVSSVFTSVVDKFSHCSKELVINNKVKEVFSYLEYSKLDMIFSEVMDNACKNAKLKILITLEDNSNNFSIIIEDDGAGVDESKNLFALFEQNDESFLTRESTGVGVGLYIAKELSILMGIDINIDNTSSLGGAKVKLEKVKDEHINS